MVAAMQRLANPLPLFLDSRGALLDGGSIYVGSANADPEAAPKSLFWDAALTIPAVQPLRTLGGSIVNGASRALVFFADGDYSMRVRDANGVQIDYVPSSVQSAGVSYQPLDADLTSIAALTTTAYGRGLLTLANQAALKAATGIVDAIPLTGGTTTGNITRGGAGVHLYHAAAALASGRVYLAPASGADPTSLPGDIWLKT